MNPFSRSAVLRACLLAGLVIPVQSRAQYDLAPAYPNFTFSVITDIEPSNYGMDRMFVVEKRGVISVFTDDVMATQKTEFLNIAGKIRTSGEAGLLGLAFHPDYRKNGQFYVFYITNYPFRTIVARYTVSQNPNVANDLSETILIDNPQATVYHNGGQLAFGPDGYLYIGMGDNYTSSNAQNLTNLPGSILRIDVDVTPPSDGSAAPRYEIPADNPFAGNTQGYREEIFAYGFRNPWRFSIDRVTGEMWVADVGEDTYEEIDLVRKGRNYGWPVMEGPVCFGGACDPGAQHLDLPLYSYTHAEGVAVIGGYRFWHHRLPELAGYYLFADYTGGEVWALRYDGAGRPERFTLVNNAPFLTTFGLSSSGDVLVAGADGVIYHLDRVVTPVGGALQTPSRLIDNFPNPFNPSTTIRYHVAAAAEVAIEIIGVDGARAARFELGREPAGDHQVKWDGRTPAGRAASGVYFGRLLVDGATVDTIRMVLVK